MHRFALAFALVGTACIEHDEAIIEPPIHVPGSSASDAEAGPSTARAEAGQGDLGLASPEASPSNVGAASDPEDRLGPIARPVSPAPPLATLPPDAELAARAREHQAAGRLEDMRAAWLQLIRDHPASDEVPGAYAAFGDHYFEEGKHDTALQFYEKAVAFPDAATQGWAFYMAAWCDLRRSEHARALERFVQALRAIEAGRGGTKEQAEILAAAVRRDLVIAYAHAARPDRAADFFETFGTGPAADVVPPAKMLQLLGRRLSAMGLEPDAEVVCGALKAADARATCAW